MTWVEKYRPKSFSEIKGQGGTISKVENFIKNFNPESSKKAILLHGPPGTGKTTIAHVIAKEANSEIFELNASDFRNKERLKEILKPALEQKPLVKQGKIILVDEVDGISALGDFGGLSELLNLIESAYYPIIITANDVWEKKFSSLRKKVEIVQIKEVSYSLIKEVMIDILKREKLFIENDVLSKISIRARGDLRAAINDLQTPSKIRNFSEVNIDSRDKEVDIFSVLRLIFKEKPTNDFINMFEKVDMPIDEAILWVEENIPYEYSGEELAKAYNMLSKVDLFKGRIYKQQYWRFLVYENIFLSYGIAASKKDIKTGFTSYKKPSRILKIWMNNQKNEKKKSISKKFSQKVHIGEKRVMQEFPVIKLILKKESIGKEINLTEEECDYLDRPN